MIVIKIATVPQNEAGTPKRFNLLSVFFVNFYLLWFFFFLLD